MSTTTKVLVTSTSSYTTPSLQSQINTALIANGSIGTIQSALLHELQASGWTTNLRNYITALMRSGECTRYDDLMDKVLEGAMHDVVSGVASKVKTDKTGEAGLRIPEAAIKEGIKVVKKELEKICDVPESK